MLPAFYTSGLLAVALIWLGIGSILARRWARALLLIFSWSWLIVGAITITVMAFVLPKVLENLPSNGPADHPAPPVPVDVIMVIAFSVLSIIYVLLPALWTFFYSSRHVKATCETRDNVLCWTDACPLPVLALCLW